MCSGVSGGKAEPGDPREDVGSPQQLAPSLSPMPSQPPFVSGHFCQHILCGFDNICPPGGTQGSWSQGWSCLLAAFLSETA